jgi:prevent-host-death family protein
METVVNVHEAKIHFSKLLERIADGEEIVITKGGLPVARLTGYVPTATTVREPGSMKGQIHMAEDFNAPLPEDLLAAFEGRAG